MNVGLKVQSKDCIEFIEKEGKAAFFFFGFLPLTILVFNISDL